MKNALFLVADIGTSGIKTGIVDASGKLLISVLKEYKTIIYNEVYVEQNPEDWWKAFLLTLKEIFHNSRFSAKDISAVSISGHNNSLLPIDKEGNPVRNAIIWMDSRSTIQCDWLLKNRINSNIEEISRIQIKPTYLLPRLLWFKENENNKYNETSVFLQTNGYLIYKLTDEFSIDITNCNLTQLYDMKKNEWSEEICNSIKLDVNKLPRIFQSYEIVGEISNKASTITGLKKGTPVVAGCNDSAASSLGVGVINEGDIFVVMGQAGAVGFCTHKLPSNKIL